MFSQRRLVAVCLLSLGMTLGSALPADADPTLKGPLAGTLLTIDDHWHTAILTAGGHLTQMGKVDVYGEFVFENGEIPGSYNGVGVAVFIAANGDLLVADIVWTIDQWGEGEMEFRWPDEIVLFDGTTVSSTGRFVDLPFAGLKATTTTEMFQNRSVTALIDMTGEEVIILAP